MKNTILSAKILTFLTITLIVLATATKVIASDDNSSKGEGIRGEQKNQLRGEVEEKNEEDCALEIKNHGEYVSCIAKLKLGGERVSVAAKSDIGKKDEDLDNDIDDEDIDNDDVNISTSPTVTTSSSSPTESPTITTTPSVTEVPTGTATITLQAQIQELIDLIKKLLDAIHL